MRRERVLITGGAGFIGRALTALCLKEGHDVTIIDNLSAGRRENLEPFFDKIEFFQNDILDNAAVRAIMANLQPSIVFHLAAHHFIPYCDQHPRETLRVNVEGTMLVLNEAARHGVGVSVVASSGSLYPSRDDKLSEDLEAAPGDVYGLSKHMTEQIARFVAASANLPCVAARLFNTYGPYETNPHLIPHIVKSLHRGWTVQLGNIHTKRDYIYVDDVADLLYRCALNHCGGFSVVNIGTGLEHSAEEIVRTIGQILSHEITIEVDTARMRTIDKLHQRADTQRLEHLTRMCATRSLIDGLRELLSHERLLGSGKISPSRLP